MEDPYKVETSKYHSLFKMEEEEESSSLVVSKNKYYDLFAEIGAVEVRDASQNAELKGSIVKNLMLPTVATSFFLMFMLFVPLIKIFKPEIILPYTEEMQKSFLLALSVNFMGMFYTIVQNLFQSNKNSTKEDTKQK
jgi:hypothetical protein